jgi:hypothetical protein
VSQVPNIDGVRALRRCHILSWRLLGVGLPAHGPEELRSVDNNGDGKTDQSEYYSDGVLMRIDARRNRSSLQRPRG